MIVDGRGLGKLKTVNAALIRITVVLPYTRQNLLAVRHVGRRIGQELRGISVAQALLGQVVGLKNYSEVAAA